MSKIKKSEKNFASQNKFKRLNSSILWRWSVANAAFFFAAIMLVALISYFIMHTSIVGSNKSSMNDSLNETAVQFSKTDQPLSTTNFPRVLSTVKGTEEDGTEEFLQTSETFSLMISSRNLNFFVFSNSQRLLFSSNMKHIPFHASTNGKIISYKLGSSSGYLSVKPIRSEKTGEIIGYLMGYYDLSSFNNLSKKLLMAYFFLVIVALIVSVFFGFQLSKYFIRPLHAIGSSMRKVAAHPEEPFEAVKIDTNKTDEITQIADFYNQMMGHVNYYVEQQRGFVSDVAHELRTPLAVIDGHIHLLQRWGKDDPKILEESVQVIINEASNMKEMLESMLVLTRLEQNQAIIEFQNRTTDPVEKIELILPNFELLHPEFKVNFKSFLPGNCLIRIDEGHYVQALMILLNNAAKYSPDSRKSVTIELHEDGDFVATSIADQGMGISKEDANLVFERFFRADKARNREIGGTGLGLPILANIVKQFGGGQVKVESELNKGSKFTFRIPKAK
ncbi:HAMP domain-containing histidine kinase [Lactovum odontotermitis]